MAAQITVDIRSFIIGTLIGVVILFAIGAWYLDRQETFPAADTAQVQSDQVEEATPDADALDYAAQFEHQQRVEDALQTRAQTMLDQIIGRNRSTVRIHAALDFSHRTAESSTVEPDGGQVVLSEETSEKNSAEHGTEENMVRNFEVNRLIENTIGPVGRIRKLSIALTVDKTKVIHDIESNEYREIDRHQEEIRQLNALVGHAVGFDRKRGDEFSMFAMRFDKSQEIQAREVAVTGERREFWTGLVINLAKIGAILFALLVLRWIWRSGDSNGIKRHLAAKDTQAALLIAAGVFFCAHALHLWGDSLSWGERGALPGLFFLLLGASRVCRHCSSPEAPQTA
jgi:flagellar biosynthesis/type III secretory pathway M-ring protein FliF/YscJ